MEETPRNGSQKKKSMGINLAKGGGPVGVGIIFVGGALTVAALAVTTFQRRQAKKGNKNHNNHDPSSIAGSSDATADKFKERKDKEETIQLQFYHLPDSSPHIQNDLISDGTGKTSEAGDSTVMSAQDFLLEDDHHKFEMIDEKASLGCDDKSIIIYSCSPDSESRSVEVNGSLVDKKEITLSVIEDLLLYQPVTCGMKDISCLMMDPHTQDNANEKTNTDEGTEETHQLKQVKIKEQEGISGTHGQETGEINTVLHLSNDKHSAPTDFEKASNRTADTVQPSISAPNYGDSSLCMEEKINIDHEEDSQDFKMVETGKRDEVLTAAPTEMEAENPIGVMIEEDLKHGQGDDPLILEKIETSKMDEMHEAGDEDDLKNNTAILASEKAEKFCSHIEDSLSIKRFKDEDMHEAAHVDDVKVSASTKTYDGTEERDCRHTVQLTNAAIGASKADELLEEAKTNNEVEAPPTPVQEKEAQLYPKRNTVGEAEEILVCADSHSDQVSKLIECQADPTQDYSHVDHGITSENVLLKENDQNISLTLSIPAQLKPDMGLKGFREAAINLDSSEIKNEIFASESVAEAVNGHNTLVQSEGKPQLTDQESGKSIQEFPEICRISGAEDTRREDHLITQIREEDTASENQDNSPSETVIISNVKERPEGSIDSSAESTAEPVSPVEPIQLASTELMELTPNQDQEEKLQQNGETEAQNTRANEIYSKNIEDSGISFKSLQVVNDENCSSKITSLERYMLEMVEQYNEQIRSLLKWEIPAPMWTLSAPLWALCFWYFGLTFLKIFLIAILVMVISKIHGVETHTP